MKVTLVSYTPDAPQLLAFTKATRLNMTPGLLDEIKAWPADKIAAEMQYMARTIPSSWEFCDFVFVAEGVTRSIAQQITRTRQASFAMQSLRVTDAASIPIENPWAVKRTVGHAPDMARARRFDRGVASAKEIYEDLLVLGAAKEDARDILPLGTTCNLVAKYNLRTLVELVSKRSSLRAQGPYADYVAQMKALVLAVYPEFEPFFVEPAAAAIEILEGVARDLGITTGSGAGWEIAKAIDLIRKG